LGGGLLEMGCGLLESCNQHAIPGVYPGVREFRREWHNHCLDWIAVGKRQSVNERNIIIIINPPFTLFTPKCESKNMKANSFRKAGFTLVEIMIVVAIIALLAAIAIPNFIKARGNSQRSACIANLKQMDGAKATWALEQKKANSDTPDDTDLFGSTAYIRTKPACPANGDYSVGQVDVKPLCSLAGTEGHTL
jgi:prepilin-type N-terminal cleavage/methylation domain-containing protein